jgi:hypothetical protein
MTKREPLFTEQYFDDHISFVLRAIEKRRVALKNPTENTNIPMVYYNLFQYSHELLINKYSRGYPMEELQKDFYTIIEIWEKQIEADRENVYKNSFKKDFSNYNRSLWLLSQAYLLKIEESWIKRLIACIRNEGEDIVFEQLIAARLPLPRKQTDTLLYPNQYQGLLDVLDIAKENRPEEMKLFLKGWYKSMKKASWHDLHKNKNGDANGYNTGFDGYWCFEAAAVAVAFDIDDSNFRDMPYYPKDLADFARS